MTSQAVHKLELLEQLISGDVHEMDLSGQLLLRGRPLTGIARTMGFGSDLPIGICDDYRV